jgi:hypothetical protein
MNNVIGPTISLYSDPELLAFVLNDIKSENSWIRIHGKECISHFKFNHIRIKREDKLDTVIRLDAGYHRHIWVDEKLSDQYQQYRTLNNIIPNSKMIVSKNKSLVLTSSPVWDTYIITKQVPLIHANDMDVELNGIKLKGSSKWQQQLPVGRILTGSVWINAERALWISYISVCKHEQHPIMLRVHTMMYIIWNSKIVMIPLRVIMEYYKERH